MEASDERKLSRNSISLFILRFDIVQNSKINFDLIIGDISKYFDRTEKRAQTNFELKFTTDKSELNKIESYDIVLINEKDRFSMTFSKSQDAFWFETPNYIDRNTYSKIVDVLLESAEKNNVELLTKRIGMRFINTFNCLEPKQITKIFKLEISKFLIQRIAQENISRIICQDEFNCDTCKTRVQYGIPNKFYPARINNFDLLLDIDAYEDKIHELGSIKDAIVDINHCAYKSFISNVNPIYLENLK